MACIIQVRFALEVVAGIGMAPRDVDSPISSGPQAHQEGERSHTCAVAEVHVSFLTLLSSLSCKPPSLPRSQ